jgi:CheY-like chemotaxis protein
MAHTLLLADDSVTVQRVIELTFRDEGMEVVAVGDGQQAIDRLAETRPDIVLADVTMPERSGYEVAEFVKTSPELSHIPVILMTGAFEQLDEARAQAAGCDGVLSKPFEPHMAISLVRQLLGTPAPVPQAEPALNVSVGGFSFASPAPAVGVGSLDDYFDRLDEALSQPVGLAVAPSPDLAGAPDAAPSAQAQGPSLADAFSAILADELGEAPPPGFSTTPSAEPAAPAPRANASDELIEEVARRVVERLSDRMVRDIVQAQVLELAARLVREEIERIKAEA